MKKFSYRIGEGANLAVFPHGTKVGDTVRLTEAQAMYERDMGRITLESEVGSVSGTIDDANQQLVIPGETQGHPVDAVSGEPLKLTDNERVRLSEIGNVSADEPATLGLSDEVDPYPEAEADPIKLKPRRGR